MHINILIYRLFLKKILHNRRFFQGFRKKKLKISLRNFSSSSLRNSPRKPSKISNNYWFKIHLREYFFKNRARVSFKDATRDHSRNFTNNSLSTAWIVSKTPPEVLRKSCMNTYKKSFKDSFGNILQRFFLIYFSGAALQIYQMIF